MEDGPTSLFSQASRPKKYLATAVLIYSCFSMGIANSFLNPTVLDFSHKLDESVDSVSIVFTVLTAGYLLGAVFNGIASIYIPRPVWVILALGIMTIPLFAVPYVESLMMLYVLTALIGIGSGGVDTSQGAWIIDIWRHEAAPFILSLHFAYSAGTLIPPLVLGPYLTEEEDKACNGTTITISTSTSTELPYESKLQVPFTIGASIACISIVIQTFMYLFVFRQNKSTSSNQNTTNGEKNKVEEVEIEETSKVAATATEAASPSDLKRTILLVALCCCVIAFYQGLELSTSQFIPTFAHFSKVCLSEKESARIGFGLQMGFASGRLCGIFLVLKIAPHFILVGNFLLLLISNIILLVWAGSNVTWLWVGSVGFGLGMSTVFPAMYAYIEKYLFVTDRITSTVAVCGGLVAAIYPIVVGKSVENNPEVLTYVNFLSLFVIGVAFSVLFYVTHVRASRNQKSGNEKMH
ncbi:unnamed protein product [Allacma fusca]|uniref:Sodium-dependent glucose transporter 1 n=1 Tax=Allacma fusca TaxID=39272 RepID=A0A8J2PH62_9HEXA|nr:unnamed protein product [Allacma fusca]